MAKIGITELVLRDAHQSLLATRMMLADMIPVAERLDRVGFWSLETWGGATFDTCIRFLNEDPWDRLRKLKAAMPDVHQQMLLRGQNLLGYRHYADDTVEAFVDLAARNGVDVFRVFDALNDVRNLGTAMRAVKKAGKHAQAAISYAVTPEHTVERYAQLAVEMQKLGADSICIKDMAGLLKPYQAAELTRAICSRVSLPLHIHSHATTGMSVASLVKAVEAGAHAIDVTISSMSMGTSHPPAETMVEIFKGTEWDTGLDLHLLDEIAAHFRDVRRKYKSFESAFAGADTRILLSQVPGGMLSNLESQLKEQDASGKMDAVLAEIAVVQKDFGYPPLVTPTSQIVGTQAVMNVLFGRYKRLTAESRSLLTGQYGATPARPDAALVAAALKESNMDRPVTGRPADALPAELALLEAELKQKSGMHAISREDVLTYAMFPQVALKFFETRAKGPVTFDEPAAAPSPGRTGGTASYEVSVDGQSVGVAVAEKDGKTVYTVDGRDFEIAVSARDAAGAAPAPSARAPSGRGTPVLAPMPGDITRLACADGSAVQENQTVLFMEALKMQMEIKTPKAGAIRYKVAQGAHVKAGNILAEVL